MSIATITSSLPDSLKGHIRTWFGRRAAAVDRLDVPAQDGLAFLAEHQVLAKGLPTSLGGDGGKLEEMVEIIATVASQCLTSAFVLWSHRVHIAYIEASGNTFLQKHVLPELLAVRKLGATGLANARARFSCPRSTAIFAVAVRPSLGTVRGGAN